MCVMMLDYFLNDKYIDKVLNILLSINREEYYITIQKICESFRISNEDKAYLKTLKIKK